MGSACQLEQADTFVQVGLVGILVLFDIPQATCLLIPPLRSHAVEEHRIDPAVELVDIHRINPGLKPVVFGLKPGDRLVMLALSVGMALMQRLAYPRKNFVIERQAAEHGHELALYDFLPHIGLRAFSPETGAVIIDVSLLLDLPNQGTTAVAAGDQTGERKVVLAPAVLARVATIQHILDLLPQFA